MGKGRYLTIVGVIQTLDSIRSRNDARQQYSRPIIPPSMHIVDFT
jgi:hypothetical protein